MDFYYRFEPNFLRPGPPTATEAGKSVMAMACRMYYSVVLSLDFLDDAVAAHLLSLVSPSSLFTLFVILSGWFFASVLGGLLGVLVTALLTSYGLWQLWSEIKGISADATQWLRLTYAAKDESELREAGKFFARALAEGLLTLLELMLTHRVFKAVETRVSKKYRPPKELLEGFERAKESRLRRIAEEARKKAESVGRALETVGKDGSALPPDSDSALPYVVGVGVVLLGAGVAVAVWPKGRTD